MSAHGRSLTDYCFAHVAQRGERWHLFDAGGLYELRRRGDELDLYDAFANWESCWHTWELPFVKWAERAGYRIDYAVNGDLEFRPDILEHYRLVLSVGHDEYWSSPMRDHLEAYIDNGGNVAFFSGNVAWWQVRSVNIGRDLVCWKDHKRDPLYHRGDHRLLTTVWCHHLIGRPENRLTGVSFAFGGYHRFFDQYQDGLHAYTVHRPDHWVFEGTGLKRGDALGAADRIVSYECDGCELEMVEGRPTPTCRDGTPSTFEVLATAPAGLSMADDSPGAAVLGTYTRGGTVFTAGCTNWSHGLAGGDEAVDRITRNVLDRLSQ
jgi:hypothetical protein